MSGTASDTNGEKVKLEGLTVFVRETGSGEPLLLINGLGAHTGMWELLEVGLEGYRIVEFDLPGAGQSNVPRRVVSMRRLALVAAAVMDRFGMDRADVLGYSMGGMVAQQLAADMPERVRRLVLVATTPGKGAVQGNIKALLNIMTPMRYSNPRMWAKTIGDLVGGRARYDKEWIANQAHLRFRHRPTWRGYLGQMRTMGGWSGLPILPSITCPTLVVTGDDDPLTPVANAKIIAHLLPHGRLLILPGEGHLLVMDDKSGSQRAIRQFLDTDDLDHSAVWTAAATVDAEQVRAELADMPRQLPPLSLLDARARERWLPLETAAPSIT